MFDDGFGHMELTEFLENPVVQGWNVQRNFSAAKQVLAGAGRGREVDAINSMIKVFQEIERGIPTYYGDTKIAGVRDLHRLSPDLHDAADALAKIETPPPGVHDTADAEARAQGRSPLRPHARNSLSVTLRNGG